MPDENGLALAILRKKEDEGAEPEDKEEGSQELEMAASNVLAAQKSGNVKEYAESLKDFIKICGY